jgi:hypothetical protein
VQRLASGPRGSPTVFQSRSWAGASELTEAVTPSSTDPLLSVRSVQRLLLLILLLLLLLLLLLPSIVSLRRSLLPPSHEPLHRHVRPHDPP